MGRFVIVAYQPKPGQVETLKALIHKHLKVLRAEKLVTDKANYVMQAMCGVILEVFEWRSKEAVEQAHENPAVQALWTEFDAACTFVPLNSLAEAGEMFAEFDSIDIK